MKKTGYNKIMITENGNVEEYNECPNEYVDNRISNSVPRFINYIEKHNFEGNI